MTVRRGSSPLARAEAGGCEFSAWRAALACIAGEARPHTTHTLHRTSRFRTQQPGNPRLACLSSCVSRPVAETRRQRVGEVSVENPESPEPPSPHPISARSGTGQWAQKTPGAYRLPDRTGQGRGAQRTWNSRSNLESCLLWGNPLFPRGPRQIPSPGMVLSSSVLMPLETLELGPFRTGATSVDSGHQIGLIGAHTARTAIPSFSRLEPRASNLQPWLFLQMTFSCVRRRPPSSKEPETETIPRLPDAGGEELGSDGDADLGILDPICLVAGHA